jgi:hypothetical protein
MKVAWVISRFLGLGFGLVMGLPLLVGIWLPDLFVPNDNVLAERQLESGDSFKVIQYWNETCYYTVLEHRGAAGLKTQVLDCEDRKRWRVPISVDEKNKTIFVSLGWNGVRKVGWNDGI